MTKCFYRNTKRNNYAASAARSSRHAKSWSCLSQAAFQASLALAAFLAAFLAAAYAEFLAASSALGASQASSLAADNSSHVASPRASRSATSTAAKLRGSSRYWREHQQACSYSMLSVAPTA
jgi:hypothetical protein